MSKLPNVIHSTKAALALLIVLLASSCAAVAQSGTTFIDGNQLYENSRGYALIFDDDKSNNSDEAMDQAMFFLAYVAGVVEGRGMKMSDEVQLAQLCQIVSDFLEANPEHRHKSARSLVVGAVAGKFPQQ